MYDVYQGDFGSWADVQSYFEMDQAEPDEVLYASYEMDGYEGSARVVYRIGDKFYTVYGGHCSCYGLEGQWDPEEYSAELFILAYEKGNWDIPSELFSRVKEFLENKYNGA
jgi:hypothetical protein